MLQFFAMSRREIEKYTLPENHIVISIADPSAEYADLPPVSSRRGVLFLKFHDLDRIPEGYNPEDFFNEKKAKLIWDFFKEFQGQIEVVIVNCEAGISRSPAVAGALAKAIGQNDAWFFHSYIPNRLVYSTLLNEARK